MRAPTHRRFGWLGLGVIAVVNALALGGVAWNRSLVDSRLPLSERELQAPYEYGAEAEDSGVALDLVWRVAPGADGADDVGAAPGWLGYDYARTPAWLGVAKLAALGYATTPPPEGTTRAPRPRDRPGWLVLELDGPAYQRHLALMARRVVAARAKLEAAPNGSAEKDRLKDAIDRLADARTKDSRLCVVDLGRDRDALRATYRDRSRYAIVEGIVSATWTRDAQGPWRLEGSIDRLRIPRLHVPRDEARALGSAAHRQHYDQAVPPFRAVVAFGRRAEPWLESVGPR